MEYRVELAKRALANLGRIYQSIEAERSELALEWYEQLEQAIRNLRHFPERGAVTPEYPKLRQIFHGRRPHTYRIIYAIDEQAKIVRVLHIRHGRRDAFAGDDIRH